jgi:aromatic-L-amino-acid/L-tryptophan decarboxylase
MSRTGGPSACYTSRPLPDSPRSPLFAYDATMTDLVLERVRRRLRMPEVPLDRPGDHTQLAAALDGMLTPGGRDVREVLAVWDEHLDPANISVDSPRYLAFIPGAPAKAALLFDLIVTAYAVEAGSWQPSAGAIAAENQLLRLLADAAGLPPEAGGVVVPGGSHGNLSALMVARDTADHRRGRPTSGPGKVAVSTEAHSSIAKSLQVLRLDALPVPTPDHRLTEAALRAALDAAPDRDEVIAVVATAGTTNAGIVDDLAGVARVAQELGAWMHVDGAYGGAALLAGSVRDRFAGIEHADSLVIDPHKWLMAPFDAAALLYRAPHLARRVHTQEAAYLDVLRSSDSAWNAGDYAFGLTRRARGLPLWFSLAVHGLDAYREAIEHSLALAARTARLIEATPHLELAREPELSTVMFRRTGWAAEDYVRWSGHLLDEQLAYVTPSRWEGEAIARFTFVNPTTTYAMVEQILATTR